MAESGTKPEGGESPEPVNLEFLESSIDRMIPVIETLAKQLGRTVISQLLFLSIGVLVLLEPDLLPEAEVLGILPISVANYVIPFILLKLHFDWGYRSFHYLLVRENLEDCLAKFYKASKDTSISQQDFTFMFIPTSAFTMFFVTNPERKDQSAYTSSAKTRIVQYIFMFLLLLSLALSNFVALYLLSVVYPPGISQGLIAAFLFVYGLCFYQYYHTVSQSYYKKIVKLIVALHVFVIAVGYLLMPSLLSIDLI